MMPNLQQQQQLHQQQQHQMMFQIHNRDIIPQLTQTPTQTPNFMEINSGSHSIPNAQQYSMQSTIPAAPDTSGPMFREHLLASNKTPSSTTNVYEYEDMVKENVKTHEETIIHADFSELKNDFEALQKMNLVDDEAYLDELYYHNVLFPKNLFLFNNLIKLYKTRYANFLKKYKTLELYMLYCLASIIFRSELAFKKDCLAASKIEEIKLMSYDNIPDVCNFGARKRKLRLMKKQNATMETELNKPTDDGGEEKKQKLDQSKKTLQHPFFDLLFYKQHTVVFHLGECLKYCIPADFAQLQMTATFGTVTKIKAGSEKQMFDGLRLAFRKPIVTELSVRLGKSYSFLNCLGLSAIDEVIHQMTSFTSLSDSFSFGRKQDVKCRDLVKDIEAQLKTDATTDETNERIIALVNNFSVFARKNKTFACKSYSNIVQILDKSSVSISPDLEQVFNRELEMTSEQTDRIIDEYYEKLENMNKS